MSGATYRRKGHDFEREFARWVRDELGIECSRNLAQYGKKDEGDTTEVCGYLPECKNQAGLELKSWWAQAVRQANAKGLKPLLIYKVRGSFRAVLPHEQAAAEWRDMYAYTIDVSKECLAMILRDEMPVQNEDVYKGWVASNV